MTTTKQWIVIGDMHDDCTRLSEIPELCGASGVLITGDITFAGGIAKAQRVLDSIATQTNILFAQPGNMDKPQVERWLKEKGWHIHATARELAPGLLVLGVGCSPPTPFHTPNEHPETQLALWLQQAHEHARLLHKKADHTGQKVRHIVLSHTPPHNTRCDKLTDGTPVGSTAVRAYVEAHQPDLCLCGHIHEAKSEDTIGATTVINPGTLADGGYIVVRYNTQDKTLTAQRKQL